MSEGETFTCAICRGVFEKQIPEEKVLEELAEYFGDVSPDDCELVCDDCWEKMGLHKEN